MEDEWSEKEKYFFYSPRYTPTHSIAVDSMNDDDVALSVKSSDSLLFPAKSCCAHVNSELAALCKKLPNILTVCIPDFLSM